MSSINFDDWDSILATSTETPSFNPVSSGSLPIHSSDLVGAGAGLSAPVSTTSSSGEFNSFSFVGQSVAGGGG